MSAVALLADAQAAGLRLRVADDGKVKVRGSDLASLELLDRLRAHKLELAELLTGERCRWCGEPMGWPAPVGIMEATGTALHHACYEASEVARLLRQARNATSPEALIDRAELTIRGRPLP